MRATPYRFRVTPGLYVLLMAWVCATLAGCASPRSIALQIVADQVSGTELADESDIELLRESAPAMLKVTEALLKALPAHRGLALQVAAGYTQYAYAFVAAEAERLQSTDARRAQELRRRAAALYQRARSHAHHALSLAHPGWFAQPRSGAVDLSRWGETDQALGYWLAASWAASIALSKEDPDVVADLPRVLALARALDNRSPHMLNGSAATLLATLEASRPGGSRDEAERIFKRALAAAGHRPTAVLVSMAEVLAEPAGDRDRFEALLNQALTAAGPKTDLLTQVMQRRAQWLLQTIEERF
jgi:predicted anti-sigma-YlaC factor YlaD